jgi:hypothetical protein
MKFTIILKKNYAYKENKKNKYIFLLLHALEKKNIVKNLF